MNTNIEQGTEAVASSVAPNSMASKLGPQSPSRRGNNRGKTMSGNELGPSGACTAASNQDHAMHLSAVAATDGDEMLEGPMSRCSFPQGRGCPREIVRWCLSRAYMTVLQ
jgi:hypothetical protein